MSEFLRDLWQFMRMRKKYWLLPIILVLMLLGGLVVVSQQSALAALITPMSGVMKTAMQVGSLLVERGADLWNDPSKAVALANQGSALTAELARLATMGEDSRTRFKGRPGPAKRVAWAEPLPLDEVKAIGRALGASVNDVLLSCAAGAIRGYLVDVTGPRGFAWRTSLTRDDTGAGACEIVYVETLAVR